MGCQAWECWKSLADGKHTLCGLQSFALSTAGCGVWDVDFLAGFMCFEQQDNHCQNYFVDLVTDFSIYLWKCQLVCIVTSGNSVKTAHTIISLTNWLCMQMDQAAEGSHQETFLQVHRHQICVMVQLPTWVNIELLKHRKLN